MAKNITKQRKDTVMCAFSLPNDVLWILDKLSAAGYRADVVGGPVRDLLRGAVPSDFDITTSATPEETERVFSGERIIETGIRHGTVTLLKNNSPYEITTYRIDGEYRDSRHPDSVLFTDRIEEDLARRDFTVNAIAYSPKNGITDPYGGTADVHNGIIRAVGLAEERFDEDALRILRGVRFASALEFQIEDKTAAAMRKKAHLLSKISKERIYAEWKKLLAGNGAVRVITSYPEIIGAVLPDVSVPKELCAEAWNAASVTARHVSLFSALSPEKYVSVMRRLKTDKHIIDVGSDVLSSLGKYGRSTSELAMMLRDIGEESALTLIECESILGIGNIADASALSAVKRSGIPYKLSLLNIDGHDLLNMGFCGAEIKEILSELQTHVLLGKLENNRYSLIKAAAVRLD